MITLEDAKDMWCPMARVTIDGAGSYNRQHDGYIPKSCRCITYDCAVWVWSKDDEDEGRCGLIRP